MLTAGVIGQDDKSKTASLINSILSSSGKKMSVVDLKSLTALDPLRIKSYIKELEKNNTDILILKINMLDEANEKILDNVNFDVIIYADKTNEMDECSSINYVNLMKKLFSRLTEKGTAIINVDDSSLVQLLQGMKYYVVTYGFNSKASVTTSSVGDLLTKDDFMCCLQRTISARNGAIIEPQEYKLKVETEGLDPYNLLAAASFALVNGVDLNAVSYSIP